MGQAAADGIVLLRKVILNHLVISSLVKLTFKLMFKTHLSTWICGSGAWTSMGLGAGRKGAQVIILCELSLPAALRVLSQAEQQHLVPHLHATAWKTPGWEQSEEPKQPLLLLLTTQHWLWKLSCYSEREQQHLPGQRYGAKEQDFFFFACMTFVFACKFALQQK